MKIEYVGRHMNHLLFSIFACLTECSILSATCREDTFTRYPNEYFVETGCHEGYGIDLALKAGFDHVYSIELYPYYVNFCRERFAVNPNVHIIEGDSGEALYDVIKDIDKPITFWLDAHLVRDYEILGYEPSPTLKELEAIKKHPIKTHTILIDDIRLFRGPDEWGIEYGFPPLDAIMQTILEINPNYEFSYEYGHIGSDILVARVP